MTGSVHVKGLSELQKFLDALPAKMEANVMRAALRAGAKVIEEAAKSNVPVSSGRLRDSIKVSTRSRRGQVTASITAGGKATRKFVTQGPDGSVKVSYENAYYAAWVEYGTAAHKIGVKYAKSLILRPNARATSGFAKRWMRDGILVEGVDHPGSSPHPYMRPALDSRAQEALLAVGKAIKKRLTKQGLEAAGNVELEAL